METTAEKRSATPVRGLIAALIVAACAAAGAFLVPSVGPAKVKNITVTARQYAYTPSRIYLDRGDEVHLRLVSRDVVHGFHLEGHDIEAMIEPGKLGFKMRHPSAGPKYSPVDEIVFIAARPGKFRYRCSVVCGTLHPFMQGEMIVSPNRAYGAGAGAAAGVFIAAFLLFFTAKARPGAGTWRTDLLAVLPCLGKIIRKRWFSFAVTLPCLVVLFFFLIAGLFGSPIGNRNIIITVVWILWWFLLITLMVPFGGRVWCMMCPLPSVGEWLARRKLIGAEKEQPLDGTRRSKRRARRWPASLSNLWTQNILFLLLCSFSTVLVTRPALTAAVLLLMIAAAMAVHLLFYRRTFCAYLCPLNSWMGLYSMTAMVEVRVKDPKTCTECREKACAAGSGEGWGCPWLLNPPKIERNNRCGMCMECIKTCPNQNMTLYVRPLCSDTVLRTMDEAWMAFIMVALGLAYTIALLGPWGSVKLWTNVTETGAWKGFFLYTAGVWFLALAVMPAAWLACAWLGRLLSGGRGPGVRALFLNTSYMLVPLGLAIWMSFSLPLIMVNVTHILASLSDPLGWGWDLLGTAHIEWKPLWPEYIVYIQIPLLLAGLAYALKKGHEIMGNTCAKGRGAVAGLIPHGAACLALVLAFMRLFAG